MKEMVILQDEHITIYTKIGDAIGFPVNMGKGNE